MRAIVLNAHGGPETLTYETAYPEPKPGPGEVLIKVGAASLNFHDVFTRRGMPGIKVPLPVVPGLDMAGEVTALGPEVSGVSVGARVLVNPIWPGIGLMGEMRDGGLAEYCVVSAPQLVPMPDGVSFAEAAAIPVAYGTAHRMLTANGPIEPGQKVLVLGASGGVGTACVMIAKLAGAEVIAAAGTEEKLQRLKELGADHLINYTTTDFVRELHGRYGRPERRSYDGGVDMVVNYTGGDTWVPSLRVLKRGGRLMVCGATAGYAPAEDLRYVWSFELKILGSNSFSRSDLVTLLDLAASRRLVPVIDRIMPLSQGREAISLLEDRQVFGKIVVQP
ncbi:MAG TPA: zinc-binding dehydrogenase [Stellaceae bacterium]|nr:zinc-binding dehydrogenase [Stellaceae bacterium]